MTERWTLQAYDLFDRDSPPSTEAQGDGLADGLAALWRAHGTEGVQADGRRTLTRFVLTWGSARLELPEQRDGARQLYAWLKTDATLAEALGCTHAAHPDAARAEELLQQCATAASAAALRAALAVPAAGDELLSLLRGAARQQNLLQWLGTGAWLLLAGGAMAARQVLAAVSPQAQTAALAAAGLCLLLALITGAQSAVLARRARRVLAALAAGTRPEAVYYTTLQVRRAVSHRLRFTMPGGTTARFVRVAEGGERLIRSARQRFPAHFRE